MITRDLLSSSDTKGDSNPDRTPPSCELCGTAIGDASQRLVVWQPGEAPAEEPLLCPKCAARLGLGSAHGFVTRSLDQR